MEVLGLSILINTHTLCQGTYKSPFTRHFWDVLNSTHLIHPETAPVYHTIVYDAPIPGASTVSINKGILWKHIF